MCSSSLAQRKPRLIWRGFHFQREGRGMDLLTWIVVLVTALVAGVAGGMFGADLVHRRDRQAMAAASERLHAATVQVRAARDVLAGGGR